MHSSATSNAVGTTQPRMVQLWDPLLRAFNWSLVAAFAVAYLSRDEALALHVWSGYALAGLVLPRSIWGFVGSRHARFTEIVTSPSASLRYLGDLFRGHARRHVGHSPAGGAMVLGLLGTPVALVGTGLQVYAVEENAGLLAGWAATTASLTLTLPAAAGDDGSVVEVGGGEQGQAEGGVWGEMQEALANIVPALEI